jgi:hypothetical protein
MADLTTLPKVKEWLEIPTGNTSKDALLNRLITAASGGIETWCGRTFALTDYVEVRNGAGGPQIVLANAPITEVTSVTVDWRPVAASTGNNQPGYEFDDTTLTLMGGLRFTRSKRNVRVAYRAGFATTPAEVEQACIELIGLRYREMDRIGMVSKQLAGEVITFTTKDFTDSVRNALEQYRKVAPS